MSKRYRFYPWMFAACALAQSATPIENDQVKVIDAHQKPHVRTALHEHKFNRVMIYEDAGKQDFIYADKKTSTLNFRAGEVLWSPAAGMHTAEIVSANPVRIIEVEIKKPGNAQVKVSGPLDPVKADPKHYKVVFENDQVRVLHVKIGPHESTPVHHHAVNRVVAYLSDQDFRVTSEDGKVEHTQHKAGEVSWGGPATHKEENLADKPFEVIVTELKN